MAPSFGKKIISESLELVKDTGREMGTQLKEAGKDIFETVGIKATEVSPVNKDQLSTLSKQDKAFKGAEIAKLKQTLFNEQKRTEQDSIARSQQEMAAKQRQAQIAAEREKNKQNVKPLLDPGSKVTGIKALFKNKKETKQQ